MSSSAPLLAVRGTFVHGRDPNTPYVANQDPLQVLLDAVAVVDTRTGSIVQMESDADAVEKLWSALETQKHQQQQQRNGDGVDLVRVPSGHLILPGLIDIHFHAPQQAFTGTATDKPLMSSAGKDGWLDCYTFPSEARCADLRYAAALYSEVVRTTLSHGTTAVYFGTVHVEPTMLLADIALAAGQRAVIGKINMDMCSPDTSYRDDSAASSVAGTQKLLQHVYGGMQVPDQDLIDVALTPRFLPTCSPELLAALGALLHEQIGQDDNVGDGATAASSSSSSSSSPAARPRPMRKRIVMQTHISESYDQVAFSASLYPDEPRDLAHFHRAGLLRPRSLLAHAVLLDDAELDLVAATGSAIASCPLSNFFFAGAHLQTCKLVQSKPALRIGLATDVAGGFSPSMLNSIRSSVTASKALDQIDNAKHGAQMPIRDWDWRHAFWLATCGGARALHEEDRLGRFAVGMQFDAQIVQPPRGLGSAYLGGDGNGSGGSGDETSKQGASAANVAERSALESLEL
jgi:guanine deaminase